MHRQRGVIWSYVIHCSPLPTPLNSNRFHGLSLSVCLPLFYFLSLPPLLFVGLSLVIHFLFSCALFLFHSHDFYLFISHWIFWFRFLYCLICPLLYLECRLTVMCVCVFVWTVKSVRPCGAWRIVILLYTEWIKADKMGLSPGLGHITRFGGEQKKEMTGYIHRYRMDPQGPSGIFWL